MDDEQQDDEQGEGEDGEGKPEPKISIVEIILVGGILGLVDLTQIVLAFFLLDDFWILDAFVSLIFVYLTMKGVPTFRQLVSWIGELIPYVGALPLNSIGWGLTVWADQHPESALTKVAQKGEAIAGKAGAAKAQPGAKPELPGGTPAGGKPGVAQAGASGTEYSAMMEEKGAGTYPKPEAQETAGTKPSERGAGKPSEQSAGGGTLEGDAPKKPEVSGEALGEKPTEFEEMQKMFKETPQEEKQKPRKRMRGIN